LLRVGKVSSRSRWNLLIFFLGIVGMSILLSIQLAGKIH
jgi:hypothetical protein